MAARYPGAIFNHLAFVDLYLRGAREIAAGRRTRRRIRGAFAKLLIRTIGVKRDRNEMTADNGQS